MTATSASADKPASQSGRQNLTGILDQLVDDTSGEQVSIGELLEAFRRRSFGPLLLIPAVIAVAPTGAIPGMSIVTGTIILLVSIQMLIGREQAWLPKKATAFSFSRDTLENAVDKAKPWASWLEQHIRSRLTFLVDPPAHFLIAAICILLAVSMFPLALLPFAVAVPGTAVGLFAIGLTMRDGVVVSFGYLLAATSAGLVWYALG